MDSAPANDNKRAETNEERAARLSHHARVKKVVSELYLRGTFGSRKGLPQRAFTDDGPKPP